MKGAKSLQKIADKDMVNTRSPTFVGNIRCGQS